MVKHKTNSNPCKTDAQSVEFFKDNKCNMENPSPAAFAGNTLEVNAQAKTGV